MSISSAMLAGVTGLVSNSSALAAISDNIANANTVGYKKVGIDFASLVNTGSSSSYAAGGVATDTRQFVTQQGTLQSSSQVTDMAISGSGFFVTTSKAVGLTPGDPRFFTRAGSFAVDQNGYLKNSAGLYLQGWPADVNGVVTPDSANLNSLQPINILAVANTAQATTAGTVRGNLNSDQVANAGIATYDPLVDPTISPAVAASMAEYASNPATGIKPDFSITVPVSDSKGGQRDLVVDFLKSTTPNQWNAEVRADPPTDVDTDPGLSPGLITSGVVAFNPDGTLNVANTTLGGLSTSVANPPVLTINLGASNVVPPAAGSGEAGVQWANALGVNAQTIALDLTGVSQFSAVSSVTSVATNGTAFGGMSGLSIDNKGMVTAVYDNGTTRTIAQVAVATFPNPNGLKSVNGDAYQTSIDSGTFTLKTGGQAGAGNISPSSLEASTVDLSSEFTGLITTQRAYSASSKIITTADQMLQELLSIKQ